MSIFGKITDAIFGSHADAAALQPAPASPHKQTRTFTATTPASIAVPTSTVVDVASVMDKAVAAKGETLDWRTSIVHMMKALNIDSSLSARKDLAKELGYSGNRTTRHR